MTRADVNATNLSQQTPLLLCSQLSSDENSLPVAEKLLSHGAKTVDLVNMEKKNVLHYALEWEASPQFVRLLLKFCSPQQLNQLINSETIHGDTALSIAISAGLLDAAETLTEASVLPCSRLKSLAVYSQPPDPNEPPVIQYKRIPHKYLTLSPPEVHETEIFIPVLLESQNVPPHCRSVRLGPKDGHVPIFPEQYHYLNQAKISTILGTTPHIAPFVALKFPSSVVISEDNGHIKCTMNDFIRSQRSSSLNPANSVHLAQQIVSVLLYMHQYLPSKPSITHNWVNRFSVLVSF